MRAMRMAGLLLLVLALAAGAFPPVPKAKEKKPAAKDLAKAIEGTWELTKFERGGEGVIALQYTMTYTISGRTLTRTARLNGDDLKMPAEALILDTTKAPPWIELKASSG